MWKNNLLARMKHVSTTKSQWLVLGVGFYVNTCVFAIPFSFGSLLNGMQDKFNKSISNTTAVQAILIGVALSSGFLSGILVSRLGMRKATIIGALLCPLGFILSFLATSIGHLYVCIGVISGVGISILFIGSTTAVGRSFTGSRGLLALAIQNAGVSVGVTVLPYAMDVLVDKYGLNGTFLIMGGIYTHSLPASLVLGFADKKQLAPRTDYPTEQNNRNIKQSSILDSIYCLLKEETGNIQSSIKQVLDAPFVLSAIAVGLIMGSLNGYFSLVVDILLSKEFTKKQAFFAFPITYGVGFVARLLPGIVKQFKGVNSFVLPIVFGTCGAIGQLLIINSKHITIIYVGCGLAGIAISGVISAANIIVVQLFVNKQNIAAALGLIYSAVGVISAIAGPTYGHIRDSTHSYSIVLYLTTAFQVIGILLFVLAAFARVKKSGIRTDSSKGRDNPVVYSIEENH